MRSESCIVAHSCFIIRGQKAVSSSVCVVEEMLGQARCLIVLIFLNQIVGQSDNRLSRRQRILSILESYQETSRDPTAPSYLAATRYNFSPARSGAAVGDLSHYRSGWGGGTAPPDRTPPPSTVEPPESPYDLWYYQDDSNNVQGPYSSFTMLEWFRAGYFR